MEPANNRIHFLTLFSQAKHVTTEKIRKQPSRASKMETKTATTKIKKPETPFSLACHRQIDLCQNVLFSQDDKYLQFNIVNVQPMSHAIFHQQHHRLGIEVVLVEKTNVDNKTPFLYL